jgi:glycosyl transferase family 2
MRAEREPLLRHEELREIRHRRRTRPFFSICIPQHNRTSFLIEVCKSLVAQTFTNFEVCISDDCSTDGREGELLTFLRQSSLSFVYQRQVRNQKYDANLRASITLAGGSYCFLLGNDDCLASPDTLAELTLEMRRLGPVGAVITNYEDFATGKQFRRVRRTGVLGRGAATAVRQFRNVSFVSGVILQTAKAQAHATAQWDGSEMYQMFLFCRMVAEGATLAGIDQVTVRKDCRVPGEQVESYVKPREYPCRIRERLIPLRRMGQLVTDAIAPFQDGATTRRLATQTLIQILLFPYTFWVIEYRRVQSWRYALGICLGMRPSRILPSCVLSRPQRSLVMGFYGVASIVGLCFPLAVFDRAYPWLYEVAKSVGGTRKS